MSANPYLPLFALTRGDTVESIHYGAVAVVNPTGELLAHYGDPAAVAFTRSTAKPFQALPFIDAGGHQRFKLSPQEITILCASHSGTDEHVAIVRGLQAKVGISESDLQCGTHPPYHRPTLEALKQRGEAPSPNRHNCSGKHSGMLAFALMQGWDKATYLDPSHPVQKAILKTFAEVCELPVDQVAAGTDGCSAPNFAVPLRNVALAYARLADPRTLSQERAAACRAVADAILAHPEVVGGPDRFDTRLMQVTKGRILAKGGAEGYQGIAILPGAIASDSPALGIALKISDGDLKSRARPAVVLEILRQLDALSPQDLKALSSFGPTQPVHNWRKKVVGQAKPIFTLDRP